jgi:type II secretion system protein G
MRNLLKRQEGFTLLELLIVIVIIGILALIIVPGLASGPARARDTTRKSDLRAVKNALETYFNDNNTYPGGNYSGLSGVLVTNYLPSLPHDPKCPSGTCSSGQSDYVYTPGSGNSNYTLEAQLENSTDSQINDAGFPRGYKVNSVQ